MLVHEAALLATLLDRIAPGSVLDIGSGTRADREIIQPHIAAAFRGHVVTWVDMNPSRGVLAGDLTDAETLRDLPSCEMVTACSVLEHVTDLEKAIENLVSLVWDWLIVSVPCCYPIHECPIDNGWRPTAEQLAKRFEAAGLEVVGAYTTGPEVFGCVPDASASLVVAKKKG